MKKIITLILTIALSLTACLGLSSCGETAEWAFGADWIPCESQLDTLIKLDAGTIEVSIIDSVMAAYYATTGEYAGEIQIVEDLILAQEEYGIAGRKNDKAFVSKINEALIAIADAEYSALIDSYDMGASKALASSATNPLANENDSSWNDIVSSGTINVGYTVFAPICYDIVDDVPTKGFDVDLANAVVDYLNEKYSLSLTITWVEIDWDAKETLLENGTIDLIWNGMTITEERAAAMCISVPYLYNRQVAVIKKSDANKYRSFLDIKSAIIGFEDGSAGEAVVAR